MTEALRGIQYAGSGALSWLDDQRDRWLVNFEPDGCVVFASKDDCVFTVEGYDQESWSPHMVNITLARKGGTMLIWRCVIDGLALGGPPELVWS